MKALSGFRLPKSRPCPRSRLVGVTSVQSQEGDRSSRRDGQRRQTLLSMGALLTGLWFQPKKTIPLSTPSTQRVRKVQQTFRTCEAGSLRLNTKTLGLVVLTQSRRSDRLSDFPGRMSRVPKAFFCTSLSLYCPCRVPGISTVVCDIG